MSFTSQLLSRSLNVFHLAGEGLTSVREIARWVAAAMDLPFERVTFGRGDRGWPGDVPRFEYDCSKAIEALTDRGLSWA